MIERPIIMPDHDVRAILEGRKTQMRRIAHPYEFGASTWSQLPDDLGKQYARNCRPKHPRYGEDGDRLWVRETWAVQHDMDPLRPSEIDRKIARLHYAATEDRGGLLWRSPLFMPRWASRITIEITDVRVQRLQEINEEDARAEGCRDFFDEFSQIGRDQRLTCGALASDAPHRASFAVLWDSTNAKRAPWSDNPWVWAISFRRIDTNGGAP